MLPFFSDNFITSIIEIPKLKTMIIHRLQFALFTLCIATITMNGCHKQGGINNINTIESFYRLPKANLDGIFWFECENLENDTAKIRNAQLITRFYNHHTTTLLNGGALTINGRACVNNGKMQNDSLFSKNVSFTITPPPNTAPAPIAGTFYSPAGITITNAPKPSINGYTPLTVQTNQPFTVTWNTDPNNTNGVEISAQYMANEPENDSLYRMGDTTFITNQMMLPDNGSAALPASFFAKFPKGATLWLMAGRGNGITVQSGGYFYQVAGFMNALEVVKVGQ